MARTVEFEKKRLALDAVAGGPNWANAGRAKYRVGQEVVHVRFCSNAAADGVSYAFNINPNTLSADYELLICGRPSVWYLIPIDEIQHIYDSPNAYRDRSNSKLRIINMNTQDDQLLYGVGGYKLDCTDYYQATLANEPSAG